jgi:hypothetical protein
MVIPGWPQIYSGRIARGRLMLFGWLILLLSGLVLIGTERGGLLLGLAVACHAASVLDVVLNGYERAIDRLRVAAVALVAVLLLGYFPAALLFGQIASPQYIGVNSGALKPGDVLLLNQLAYTWASPAPGDVVVYNLEAAWVPGAHYRVEAGRRVDRVLAIGGQSVKAESGLIRVDGKPPQWLPLNPSALQCSFDVVVPPHHCLILPSTDLNITEEVATNVCLVPNSAIRGRVYLRSQPFNRFGPL